MIKVLVYTGNFLVISLILFTLIVAVRTIIATRRIQEQQRRDNEDLDDGDKALIVAFLAERGASSVQMIQVGMRDFTRGDQDWSRERTLRHIYRQLERLEREGTIVAHVDGLQCRYRLVRPDATVPVR
jgi:hypothetical protein